MSATLVENRLGKPYRILLTACLTPKIGGCYKAARIAVSGRLTIPNFTKPQPTMDKVVYLNKGGTVHNEQI